MKQLYYFLSISLIICFFSCQADDSSLSNIGYLDLRVDSNNFANTKTVSEDYKPKQIAVQIINSKGQVVKETDDSETWETPIALETGTYTIKASSNGFDGQESGFDIPYYAGSKEITIQANKELQETITCTLANVKVSVKFDPVFLEKFEGRTINVQVGDQTNTNRFAPLIFSTTETRSAYFPVGNLYATISINNPENPLEPYTLKQEITDVQARDHYILNYKVQDSGSTNITVTVDPTTHEYSYIFTVSTEATNKADLTASAWDRLAYLKAQNVTTASGVGTEGITFQYRVKSDVEGTTWDDVVTTNNESSYTAMLTGLKSSTTYEYRLINGEGEAIGSIKEFTTANADLKTPLPNGDFEEWSVHSAGTALGNKNTTFPCSDSDYANNRFWDTSNRGANSGGQKDPTNKTTDFVQSGTYSAKLGTISILGNLAAASLYTGDFGSASISGSATVNFGKPFTSRPIALHGYYKYTATTASGIDKLPSNITLENNLDQCAIFIVLMKSDSQHEVNNTKTETLLSVENIKKNDKFIAYGELPSGASTTQEEGLVEFSIPLKYKEQFFGEQPTHIIIVCSASKYGDYMVGGAGSTMYVDNFELIYDGEPTLWE